MTRAMTLAFLFACLAGCGKPPVRQAPPPGEPVVAAPVDESSGLHDGLIVDWGDGQYHAEVCFDRAKREVTVYVHGGELRVLAPVKAKRMTLKLDAPDVEVELTPSPQTDDPEGTASRYVGRHDRLGEKGPFVGVVAARIEGEDFRGTFVEAKGK